MAFNKAKALLEAQKYVAQGKNALAIKQYATILENDPSDLTLLNTIGDLYVRDGNIPEGLKQFYHLAEAYGREGFIVKAIAIYKKISKIDRNTAEPYLRLMELYLTQGLAREAREQCANAFEFYRTTRQEEKALEVLRRLIRLDPNNANSHLKLAQYAETIGEGKEAADAYLEAANAAQRKGDTSTAESALSKAEEISPGSPELQLFRAQQAFNNQQPEQVESILASVPDLRNDPRAQRLLLGTYLAAHDLDAACRLLLDVFRRDPSDFSPVANYAAQCIAAQDYDRAFEAARSVAQDLIDQKKTGPLMEVLRKIWAAAPERIDNLELIYSVCEKTADEFTIPEILEALGHAYVRAGELTKAEQAFAKLVAREPQNESYKDLLKHVLQKQSGEYRAPDLSALPGAGIPLDAESSPVSFPSTEVESRPEEAAGQAPVPEEIDLSQCSSDLSVPAEEQPFPQPQEIPLEFKTRQESSCAPEEVSPAFSETQFDRETASAVEKAKPAEQGISPFNYQESREEIEFYITHGFDKEAQEAVRDLAEKYPGESGVAALRGLVDGSGRGEECETELLGSREGESQASPDSTPLADQQDVLVDLAGELASTLGDLPVPESRPLPSDAASGLNPLTQSADDAAAELSALLEELQEGEPAEKTPDDPQTHYNLGVAFREMGLYDEAIGEFQKAVKGATFDHSPSNFLQACTLLAACFVDKGMPAIAVNWYVRALETSGLDEDAVLALRYDLGAAYEQAGDPKRALEKFTEVYSQNIDYRDVAEKIRILRQKAS